MAETSVAPTIRLEIDDSICVLTFDRPESGANIFDAAALSDLDQQLDFIEEEDSLEGVVILSAKKSIFIAGADLKTLLHQAQTGEMRVFIAEGQQIFNRLAALKISTCAAIHGACAGGGYEIARWKKALTLPPPTGRDGRRSRRRGKNERAARERESCAGARARSGYERVKRDSRRRAANGARYHRRTQWDRRDAEFDPQFFP